MVTIPPGRPTLCFVDLDALRWNFRQIRSKVGPQVKILSMVKANGYGHGATAIATALAAEGSDAFGVATLEEAIELRQAGIRTPILVLAGVYLEQLDQFLQNNLTPVVHELETLRGLEAAVQGRATTMSIHLKVDTGMGRIGLLAGEIDSWLRELSKLQALKLEGIFSHFSDGESVNEEYTENQLTSFLFIVERLRRAGFDSPLIHMAKSAALVTLPGLPFHHGPPGIDPLRHLSFAGSWQKRSLSDPSLAGRRAFSN